MESVNMKIASTMLGTEDHGIFTFWLSLEGDGTGCGFGGWSLDGVPKPGGRHRQPSAAGMGAIMELMRVLNVAKWEDVKDQCVRVVFDGPGLGRRIVRVGHLIKDQWFDPKEYFAKATGESHA